MADALNRIPVETVDDADFDRRAAQLVIEELAAALRGQQSVLVALAGGSTPRGVHAQLAMQPGAVDWSRVRFVWGDERCVPDDDPASNVRMARESLLEPLGWVSQVYAPRTDLEPQDAANAYEIVLRGLDDGQMPRLDLAVLGMGADGHTASLFPSGEELELPLSRLVAATCSPEPPHDRLSLTLPMFNGARSVLFLVRGESKASAMARVVAGDLELPAARVRPADGRLRWLVDRSLARAAGLASA